MMSDREIVFRLAICLIKQKNKQAALQARRLKILYTVKIL